MAEEKDIKQEMAEEKKADETVKKTEIKKEKQEKVKKDKAVVNVKNVHMSLKHAVAICRVIKNKNIIEAIYLLEKVTKKEIAIPMKGELPHRKGMMSGRYPFNASEKIIKILKSLMANSIANGLDMDEIIISEAIPNTGGKATSSKKGKRVHITLVAKEKNKGEKK
jgi:ribosomal protein L22